MFAVVYFFFLGTIVGIIIGYDVLKPWRRRTEEEMAYRKLFPSD